MELSGSVATWETTEHRFFAWEVLGNRSGSPHLLLSQTTISSRSFPPTLPLPLPRRATAVQRTVSSQSVPGHQPATHMTPGPASSSTNLLSPSVTRQGVQAAFVRGPKVLRHISGTSSIVRVHPLPFAGMPLRPAFIGVSRAIIPTPPISFSFLSIATAWDQQAKYSWIPRTRRHTLPQARMVHQFPTRYRPLGRLCPPSAF